MDINNNDIFKFIGKQIRDLRKNRNITIEELSLKTNMAEGTLKIIESGASASFLTYYNISKALDIPLDAFTTDLKSCDYTSELYSDDIHTFLETYKKLPYEERKRLMNVIKAFLLPTITNERKS